MSVIVAVVEPEYVVLGADSAAVDPRGILSRCDKLRYHSPSGVVFAVAGDTGMIPIVEMCLTAPSDAWDIWAQNLSVKITIMAEERKLLDEDGTLAADIIVAYSNRAWSIDTYVAHKVRNYTAFGSGGEAALGALCAIRGGGLDAATMVNVAVGVACKLHSECDHPSVTMSTHAIQRVG